MRQGTLPVFILVDTSMWAKTFLGGNTASSMRVRRAVNEILEAIRLSSMESSWTIRYRAYLLTYGGSCEWLLKDDSALSAIPRRIDCGGSANLGDALDALDQVMRDVEGSESTLLGSYILLLSTGRSDDRWGDKLRASVVRMMVHPLFRNAVRLLFSMTDLSQQWSLRNSADVNRVFRHVGDLEQVGQLKAILPKHIEHIKRQSAVPLDPWPQEPVRKREPSPPARKSNEPLRAALNKALQQQGVDILKYPKRLASYAMDGEGVDDTLSFVLSLNFTQGLLNICYEAACDSNAQAALSNAADRIANALEHEHLLQHDAACTLACSLVLAVADYLGVGIADIAR